MRPRIFLENGRWHVFRPPNAVLGFLLMRSAFAYAEAIWRGK